MNRSPGTTVAWLGLLGLCALGLTVSAMFALIVPDYRGITFYSVMASLCLSELVLFGYSAYFLTVPQTVKRPSPAVRMRILVLIVLWFLVILISGVVAVHPAQADTFYSDKVLVFQAILTFFLLAGAFFLHRQDVWIQQRDDAPMRERVHLQSYAGGVDALIDTLRSLANRLPAHAVELDRLTKRFDLLKSQLLSVSPVAERPMDRLVEPISTEEVESQIRSLREQVTQLGQVEEGQLGERVVTVRENVDTLIALLRRREDVIAF